MFKGRQAKILITPLIKPLGNMAPAASLYGNLSRNTRDVVPLEDALD